MASESPQEGNPGAPPGLERLESNVEAPTNEVAQNVAASEKKVTAKKKVVAPVVKRIEQLISNLTVAQLRKLQDEQNEKRREEKEEWERARNAERNEAAHVQEQQEHHVQEHQTPDVGGAYSAHPDPDLQPDTASTAFSDGSCFFDLARTL